MAAESRPVGGLFVSIAVIQYLSRGQQSGVANLVAVFVLKGGRGSQRLVQKHQWVCCRC